MDQIFCPDFDFKYLVPCESVCSDHHQFLISEGKDFIQQYPLPPTSCLCAQKGLLHPEFPRMIMNQYQSEPQWLSDYLKKVLFICIQLLTYFPFSFKSETKRLCCTNQPMAG